MNPMSVMADSLRDMDACDTPTLAMDLMERAADEIERLAAVNADLLAALKAAISMADEVRDEWDKAPADMKAGKLLIALSGHLQGYRSDIDRIHAALRRAEGKDAP
jgi:hypothetical protein